MGARNLYLILSYFQASMYFYGYYIKEIIFKQNKIPIFINLAFGCKRYVQL